MKNLNRNKHEKIRKNTSKTNNYTNDIHNM